MSSRTTQTSFSVYSGDGDIVRFVILNWPFTGRGKEVDAILADLRRGVGTVIAGEAGVGKTMLAREVQRQMDLDGWRTHLVRCTARSGFPLPALSPVPINAAGSIVPRANVTRAAPSRGRSSVVLVVDDAHVLDDESAELLWRLAGGGDVVVVATVRSGERAPDRVARLWADGACARLDLAPLAERDVRGLLELALGGDVEDRLPRILVRRAGGNALLIRELVRSGVDSGAIVRSQQVWRLAGELPVGAGASDIIRSSLTELSPPELAAAQLLAVGEPLLLDMAESLIGHELMEALEERRVAALADTPDGPVLTLGHPLYGDVLRSDIAPLRLRRLRSELIEASRLVENPSPDDVLRSVVWRLEIGDTPTPDELLAAARLARSSSQVTAERLTRAALAAGSTPEALGLLAEILVMEGRVAEAEKLLDELALQAVSDEDRQAVTFGRALCRVRLGEVSEVVTMVTGATLDQAANSLLVQAVYAQALTLDGRIDEAIMIARPLFEDETADPVTRTIAGNTVAATSAMVGRTDDCERFVAAALPLAEAALSAVPFGWPTVLVASSIGLTGAGRLDEADHLSQQNYDRALAEDNEWMRPRGASGLGIVALMRGQARTATRYFRIAVASLNELDGQYQRYNLSYLARGAALAGLVDEARQALRPQKNEPNFPFYEADWMMAEAALAAAEGTLETAADRALHAARQAASLGAWAVVGLAAHDAARYAAAPEAAPLVATAAERVDGPLHPCLRDFAQARVADDPKALAAVSERFEALGTILFAAEASYAAARAFRLADEGRAAAAASLRATALHARCQGASIPWVAGFQASETLTGREQQTALLASVGYADAAIATELEISVRTVQNHLARAYRKLGVEGRHDLPDALAGIGDS
jgi:DNA-binding CsgD family transcriptional regulator